MELTDIEVEKILELMTRAKSLKYSETLIRFQDGKLVSSEITEKIRY